jgi:4-hydroxy-2-oxoheptanedioate aldolase
MIGLLGFDCLWICNEHGAVDWDRLGHLIRTATMNDMDTMIRTSKGSYTDFVRPLELGAAGLMIPHCMSTQDAKEIARMTRFHPIGRRPLDSGNSDGHYCMIPLSEYLRNANENTFIIVQIEDPEALDSIEEIAAVPGIDALFIGPADLSHGLGVPGQVDHPQVNETIRRVADACRKNGKAWGLPVRPESASKYLEMGARFLASGADVLGLQQYYRDLRKRFEDLGVEFSPKIP